MGGVARAGISASKGRAARVALGLALAATALQAVAWPSFASAEGLSLVAASTVEVLALLTGAAAVSLAVASLVGRPVHGASGERGARGAAVAAIVIAVLPAALLVLDLSFTPAPGL